MKGEEEKRDPQLPPRKIYVFYTPSYNIRNSVAMNTGHACMLILDNII